MKVLFHLGHPAHFHLFKKVIHNLNSHNHRTFILINKKDVLEELLINEGFEYKNILPDGRKNSKFSVAFGLFKQDLEVFLHCLKNRPDLMVGSSVPIAHVNKILGIKTINFSEDDANVVPLHSMLAYPFTNTILSPSTCDNSRWEYKSIKYEGYHELAYLHPKTFKPDIKVCQKYFSTDKPYFILRFSGLNAHHDSGIEGINDSLGIKLVKQLLTKGNVFITSERPLIAALEIYRRVINPADIHHILAYAKMYIGDSQTMAAEAGVLGTPFIRFNDFVGRIGYLNELENKYELGYGIKSKYKDQLLLKVIELISLDNLDEIFEHRRQRMLSEKIELSSFLTWFIENYPKSKQMVNQNPDYPNKFK